MFDTLLTEVANASQFYPLLPILQPYRNALVSAYQKIPQETEVSSLTSRLITLCARMDSYDGKPLYLYQKWNPFVTWPSVPTTSRAGIIPKDEECELPCAHFLSHVLPKQEPYTLPTDPHQNLPEDMPTHPDLAALFVASHSSKLWAGIDHAITALSTLDKSEDRIAKAKHALTQSWITLNALRNFVARANTITSSPKNNLTVRCTRAALQTFSATFETMIKELDQAIETESVR